MAMWSGARLHAELVALGPGIPDEAGGALPFVRLGVARLPRARGVRLLIVGVVSLVNFDHGFERGVVIAPVRALLRGGGMGGDRGAGLARVGVERNTIVGIDFLTIGFVVAALGYIGVQSIPIAAFGFAVAIIGALILLIVPESIPQDAYKALLKDSITNIEIVLEESQLRERAYFLKIEDEVRAFIPISASPSGIESSQLVLQNLSKAPKRFITNYRELRGLTLVPPGNEIVKPI